MLTFILEGQGGGGDCDYEASNYSVNGGVGGMVNEARRGCGGAVDRVGGIRLRRGG
jgi:hypothetical protein